MQDASARDQAFQEYVRSAASTGGGSAEELTKLADLRDRGVINEAEFQAQKARLLA